MQTKTWDTIIWASRFGLIPFGVASIATNLQGDDTFTVVRFWAGILALAIAALLNIINWIEVDEGRINPPSQRNVNHNTAFDDWDGQGKTPIGWRGLKRDGIDER